MTLLKKQLIKKIQELEDEGILRQLMEIIELETNKQSVYKLSEEQKQAVEEGREQYKTGEFLSDEEANKLTEQWLSNK